jgi:hypothetical protein
MHVYVCGQCVSFLAACVCVYVLDNAALSAFFPRHNLFSLALVRLPVAMCVYLHALFLRRFILSPDGVLLCVCVSIEHLILCVSSGMCELFLRVFVCSFVCVCVCGMCADPVALDLPLCASGHAQPFK